MVLKMANFFLLSFLLGESGLRDLFKRIPILYHLLEVNKCQLHVQIIHESVSEVQR